MAHSTGRAAAVCSVIGFIDTKMFCHICWTAVLSPSYSLKSPSFDDKMKEIILRGRRLSDEIF